MKHLLSIFAVLALLWLANSGHYTPLLLAFGLASTALVTWLSHRLGIVDYEALPVHLFQRLPAYYGWLLKQLIAANIDVVKRIWRGNTSISPCTATLSLSQRTDIGRVIYGNSLTLTPGTIALDLTDTTVTVHALTESALQELRQGEMDRRVSELED